MPPFSGVLPSLVLASGVQLCSRLLLGRILAGRRDLAATVDEALAHTRLLEAEEASLASGAPARP